jgi:hypothetical protein
MSNHSGLFLRLERRRDPGMAWRNVGRRDGPNTHG